VVIDDFDKVKLAFSNIKSAKTEVDYDVQGNPIFRVRIDNVKMIFYFDVNEYSDEAKFSNLIVKENGNTE
jgi:hypothetical protein